MFATGIIGLTGLFVAALFVVPRLQEYLSRREHHERMYHRRPFSADEPPRPRPRRRGRKGA